MALYARRKRQRDGGSREAYAAEFRAEPDASDSEAIRTAVLRWLDEAMTKLTALHADSGQIGRSFRLIPDTHSGDIGHLRSEATLAWFLVYHNEPGVSQERVLF
jgi:hypothetical protein